MSTDHKHVPVCAHPDDHLHFCAHCGVVYCDFCGMEFSVESNARVTLSISNPLPSPFVPQWSPSPYNYEDAIRIAPYDQEIKITCQHDAQ
jgi:hypothetical protein